MSDQPSMRLSDIRKGERYRRDLGDIDGLAVSIAAVGLLHPIVVTSDNLLVAGERRLAAVARLGWVRVPVRVIDPVDLLAAERQENEARKDFTPSEAAAIAKALLPAARAAAKERQGRPGQERSSETDGHERVDDTLAAAVGMGRTSLRQATEVVEAAAEDPTLDPIVEAMDETGNVSAAHRALIAVLMAEPGHVRLRDALAWWATEHVPGVRALRSRWASRRDRPGFRPGEWS